MATIDLAFSITGTAPRDHGYALYGALSRLVERLHEDPRVGVHPIRGARAEPGRLTLTERSRLRLRLPSEDLASYLGLAGKALDLESHRIRVGVPRVEPLIPASALMSRLVTIKGAVEPNSFAAMARSQLDDLGIAGELSFVPATREPWVGQPLRRVLRIKDRQVIGYAVYVEYLTAEESLRLQEHGLGGRRRMGCGVFVPIVG